MYLMNNGCYQVWVDNNYENLVPLLGHARTYHGELLRVVDAMYYAYHSNDIDTVIITSKWLMEQWETNPELLRVYVESKLGEFGNREVLVGLVEWVYDQVCLYIQNTDDTELDDPCEIPSLLEREYMYG